MPPRERPTTAATPKPNGASAKSRVKLPDGAKAEAIEFAKVKINEKFKDAFRTELDELLDLPATLRSDATTRHDGRLVKLVLVTIHDRTGRSRAGIPVQLLDDGNAVVDRAFTSRTGFAILTFPGHAAHHTDGDEPDPTKGTIRILDGTANGITKAVEIGDHTQFADLTLMLEELPEIEVPDAESTLPPSAGLWPPPGLGDDPLTNLPPDFTPELCEAIAAKAGDEGDSLLGKLGDADDFRTRRTPLIKRLSVVRNGELPVATGSKEPRRYLVRLRQSWIFLGYTLGELAEVDALDPGSIIDETVGTVERSVEDVTQLVDRARSFATSSLSDVLNQTSKIDTLVKAATSTEVNASVGGWGIGIPGLFGIGSIGVGAGLRTGATTSTNVDTSLNVNHSISTAQTFVNEAVHSATRTLSSLARTVTTKVGRVSPLLSRVTNLLRWRVYENYAVCTHVEDVLELKAYQVLDIDPPDTPWPWPWPRPVQPVFSAREIVEYRRFFEAALLDPRYRSDYPALVDAVRTADGGRPITHVTVEADYSATLATGRLVVEINGAAAELRLRPENGRAVGVVRFQQAVPANQIRNVEVRLTSRPDVSLPLFQETFDHLMGVDVTKLSFWAGVEPGMPPSDVETVALHHDGDTGPITTTFQIAVQPTVVDATKNALWIHINQNPSYYLGVLAQAALLYPSLRDDSDKLQQIPADVWRLPIVGFEGNRIIVAKDPEAENSDVEKLLSDPGAATLVQIAAPGAYSEALQGLLSLVDAEGLIHPSLIPEPPAQVPPLQIVDLTGKQLVPASSNGTTPAPTPSVPTTPILPIPIP